MTPMTDSNQGDKPRIRVTVTFEIVPEPLAHWDASTVEEAAENLSRWYEDGSADIIQDVACAANLSTQIEVVR